MRKFTTLTAFAITPKPQPFRADPFHTQGYYTRSKCEAFFNVVVDKQQLYMYFSGQRDSAGGCCTRYLRRLTYIHTRLNRFVYVHKPPAMTYVLHTLTNRHRQDVRRYYKGSVYCCLSPPLRSSPPPPDLDFSTPLTSPKQRHGEGKQGLHQVRNHPDPPKANTDRRRYMRMPKRPACPT